MDKLPSSIERARYRYLQTHKPERFAFFKTFWEIIKELIK